MDISTNTTDEMRPVLLVIVKRLWIRPLPASGEDKYGHWWLEIGDPLDGSSESYGWWPVKRVGKAETLTGVAGCLNGAEAHGGQDFRNPPPRDPHHGDNVVERCGESFHPLVAASDPRNDEQIAECLRRFARAYSGTWRWTAGWGQNCRTFQRAAMAHCKLSEPAQQSIIAMEWPHMGEAEHMSGGPRPGDPGHAAVEYFKSFDGYGPELSPVAPLTFDQTRRSAAYAEVERDAFGFVAVLRKIGVTRSAGLPVLHTLSAQRPVDEKLVLEAIFDPRIDEYLLGAEVDYLSTRAVGVFFEGTVEADGCKVTLRLFRRSVVFSEVYDRDSTGRLATALHFTADRLPRIELFGDGGSPLPLADRYVGARRIAAASRSEAEELRQRAKQSFGKRQYQSAIVDLQAALQLVEGADDDHEAAMTLANILCNLGTGWLYLKDYDRAAFFAASSLELHARHQSVRGVGVCTLTLGSAFAGRKMDAQAAECHRQAAHLFLKAGDAQSRHFVLDQLHAIESRRSSTHG